MRTLNYPLKYEQQNVNLYITHPSRHENPDSIFSQLITEKIEKFIQRNSDFSNLLPLNQPLGTRPIDLKITITTHNTLQVSLVNMQPFTYRVVEPGFEDEVHTDGEFAYPWLYINKPGLEVGGEGPPLIWQSAPSYSYGAGREINYQNSAWPSSGGYLRGLNNQCGSCGLVIDDDKEPNTRCDECGVSIHGDGLCGPWIDEDDYDTACCTSCYEYETGEDYGGYNILKPKFMDYLRKTKDNPNKGITYRDIKETLTFIEETFNLRPLDGQTYYP